jgi:hypothetical protein
MTFSIHASLALLAAPAMVASQVASSVPDGSRLKLGTDSLAVFFIQGTDTVRTGIIVDDLHVDSSVTNRHLVRIYRTQDQVLGQGVDTILDFLGTLQPFAYYSRRPTGGQALQFSLGRVAGWLFLVDGDSVPIDMPLPRQVFNFATFDLVLRASPLRRGLQITVPAFFGNSRSVTPLTARVVGVDAIHNRPCWTVKAEFMGMPVTFWIDTTTRQLRQQVMQTRADTQILFTTM